MNSWQKIIEQRITKLYPRREFRAKVKSDNIQLITATAKYSNWVSNDYLGLSNHSQLRAAFFDAVNYYGVGSTGAPTQSGYSIVHDKLANNLAAFLGFEKCLLFNSGYQLAVGLYRQLADSDTIIWLDRRMHASHIDGICLAKVRFFTFDSNTIDKITADIQRQRGKRHIILTEATFSMDGTCDYLGKLFALKHELRDEILLIIDDAHGIGALGVNGKGSCEQLNLPLHMADLVVGTLGKAFGCHGGFIVGNTLFINYLQQTSRSLLFSTCLPPGIVAAADASLKIIHSEYGANLRKKLLDNINFFLQRAAYYKLPVYHTGINISAIQLLIFNNQKCVIDLADNLLQQGILVGRMLFPTVARDEPRVRISLRACHKLEDIETLCSTLHRYI